MSATPRPGPPRRPDGADPTVEIVICAYTDKRWDQMVRAVRSAQQQTVPVRRVLLCIDHNEELARRASEQWPVHGQVDEPPVVVLRNRFPGRLGSTRNTALEQVEADVVAFLDDDAFAAPDWIQTLLRVYREEGAVAVGGAPRPVFETALPRWFPTEFQWVFGCHYDGLPETRQPVAHLIGANMSVRTAAFRALDGFRSDNHDDMDLSHRVAAAHGAAAVVYEPAATVCHYVTADRVTWEYFWKRCYHVNRGKVRAFHDMGHAGNLSAELAFARSMATSVARRLGRAVRGDTGALGQAGAIVAGLALAGAGHVSGRLDLRRGRTPESLTQGLAQQVPPPAPAAAPAAPTERVPAA